MPAPNIPNSPLVDPRTGELTEAWRKYFRELGRLLAQALGE